MPKVSTREKFLRILIIKTSNIYHSMENVDFIARKTNDKRKNQRLLGLGLKDYL